MIIDYKLVASLRKKNRVISLFGKYPILYKIGSEYNFSKYLQTDSSVYSHFFELALPNKPALKFEQVKSFELFFPKTRLQHKNIDKEYMYFNKEYEAILEETDFDDFYLLIEENKGYGKDKTFHLFYNFELQYSIDNAVRLIYNKYNFDADNMRFARRIGKDDVKGSEIWIRSDGIEKLEDENSLLQFKRWCDSYIEYRNLQYQYYSQNEISIDSPDLRWNDMRLVKWQCEYGHVWQQSVRERAILPITSSASACPFCEEMRSNKDIDDLRREIEETILEIQSGECLKSGFEEETGLITCSFKHPLNKNTSIAAYLSKSALEFKQVTYDTFEAKFQPKQINTILLLYYCLYLFESEIHTIRSSDNLREVRQFLSKFSLEVKLIDLVDQAKYCYEYYKITDTTVLNNINLAIQKASRLGKEIRRERRKEANRVYSVMIEEDESIVRWKTERRLYLLVKSVYHDAIFQFSAEWLSPQTIDIYIPSIKVAIEFQGKQHFKAIEFFGGDDSLQKNQIRDQHKRDKCARESVALIEWLWLEEINEELLDKKIRAIRGEQDTR